MTAPKNTIAVTAIPTTRRSLSKQQEVVLRAFVKFVHVAHRQPSYAELADLLNMSSVQRIFAELEAKGWLHRSGGKAKAIEISGEVFDEIVGTTPAEVE
jgi:SOS-response transcriptional repressor LexA